jgi:histidinol-phosphate aminotransferase
MLPKAYLTDGDEAVLSEQSFVMYPIAVASVHGKIVMVPATSDRCHDVEAMARAVTPQTKLVYIANPSNPTGTYITRKQMDRLFELLPDHVLLVVDQAYQEYIDRPDYPDTLEDLKAGRNVIVLRTFSKIYGLAGLRLGYGITRREVVETLNHVRSPFNTSNLAQAAGLAALDDDEWAERCRADNAGELRFLQTELRRRQVRFTPSVTNFVLVEFDSDVKQLFIEFQRRGVIPRPVGGPGLSNCMRVSIGTRPQNERFLAVLDELI